ncbi:MAG: hypothetical protein KBA86_00750 [Bacteroidales bacterium]|nr:hypothetical protein [Bacteroidales bacterium]
MKIKYLLIFILIILLSCKLTEHSSYFKKEKKVIIAEDPCGDGTIDSLSIYTYSIYVPENYRKDLIPIQPIEIIYFDYKDSSMIYVCLKEGRSVNFKNIENLGDSIYKKRFKSVELDLMFAKIFNEKYEFENMVLGGIDSNGNYWKDIKYECVSYGYINVKKKDLKYFENALKSFRKISKEEYSNSDWEKKNGEGSVW